MLNVFIRIIRIYYKILETISELILPLLKNIVSFPNLDKCQTLVDKFKYLFQKHLTKYKRNSFF